MPTLQRILRQTDLVLGLALLVTVAMLILPLPHWALDAGLVVAIAVSVVILLAAVNVDDPLRFSVFPSLLLLTTLFRLALSIVATKLILGTGNGGQVIQTFGQFVMRGDFVVGFVAFMILMIVQFIVITNGAGRVAEVVARFTLDAMPGRQMAIDADLAAGLINEDQARERREKIKSEADFYGAMDGASKFVKGDAIASLLIILVNIVGGIVVGFMRSEGDILTILRTYALLSVGEGLVSQIPALLISTAGGLLVTRAGQRQSMGGEVLSQLIGQPRALGFAGLALIAFGFVPGFPAMLFIGIGSLLGMLFFFLRKNPSFGKMLQSASARASAPAESPPTTPPGPDSVLPLLGVDPLEIEIGYGLTRLADVRVGGDLPERITATRRQIALELGFVMPSVRIRDSIALSTNEYVVKVRGEEVARAIAEPNALLAIGGSAVDQALRGMPTKEPVFGLDALWIEPSDREEAERRGYAVIEPAAMIATHLSEIVKTHAAELITRQDVQTLIETAKEVNAAVVDELVPGALTIGDVQKVLQHLLRERIPIRDMVTILETMADFAPRTKDPDQLGELVRAAMSRTITRQHLQKGTKLFCLTLEPALERKLADSVQQSTAGALLVLEPEDQQRLIHSLRAQCDAAVASGCEPVLLVSSSLRLPLRRLLDRYLPSMAVLAYNEVAAKAEVEFVGQVQAA